MQAVDKLTGPDAMGGEKGSAVNSKATGRKVSAKSRAATTKGRTRPDSNKDQATAVSESGTGRKLPRNLR